MPEYNAFNVKSFGAVGDGSSNDTDAINNAINALINGGGGTLHFPFGRYLTKEKHSIDGVPCRISGDGVGLSAIEWDTQDGGFRFTGGNFSENFVNSLHVTNLALLTRRRLGGTALFMEWADGNKSVVQHFALENVQIKGSSLYAGPSGQMWTTGVHCRRAFNSALNNVQILGSATVAKSNDISKTVALYLENGSGPSTQFLISGFYANFYGTGIQFDHVEGIYLSNFELVLNRNGVKGTGVYVAMFSNGHIDYRQNGIAIREGSSVRITDCDIKHAPVLPGNAMFFEECVDVGVSGCSIHGPGDNAGFHANGVVVTQFGKAPHFPSEHAIITGNSFRWFPDQGVWLKSGTRRNRIFNNTFESIGGNNVLDQGQDNETN